MASERLNPPISDREIQENRASFEKRINFLNPAYQQFVMYAYDMAKYAHRDAQRDDGERYFEHPREVAIIAIDELKVQDPEVIATLLLHDVFEDSSLLGNGTYGTYEENKSAAMFRVSRSFSTKVAKDIISVSKPKGRDVDDLSKQELEVMYHKGLDGSSFEALLVKGCDRLHNLRTLGGCTMEKQLKKVKETEEVYFPLFERLKIKYPREYEYLISEMKKAISALNLN